MKYLVFIALCLVPLSAFSQRKEMPLDSLNYIHFMQKADFDKRFPGKLLRTGDMPAEDGYYIVYEHESLTYYFGPAVHRSVAEIYKEELDKVVAQVQQMRAVLKSAETYILKLPEAEASEAQSTQSKSEPRTPAPSQPPEPEPEQSWWTKLVRALGF